MVETTETTAEQLNEYDKGEYLFGSMLLDPRVQHYFGADDRIASKTDAGAARSAGIQNFILAGRPSKSDFVRVYGSKGPSWTWAQREAAGVSAEQFQAALAKK